MHLETNLTYYLPRYLSLETYNLSRYLSLKIEFILELSMLPNVRATLQLVFSNIP